MYCNLWPYVWLVFKSGFLSRAAYDGARTVTMQIVNGIKKNTEMFQEINKQEGGNS